MAPPQERGLNRIVERRPGTKAAKASGMDEIERDNLLFWQWHCFVCGDQAGFRRAAQLLGATTSPADVGRQTEEVVGGRDGVGVGRAAKIFVEGGED